MSPSFLSLIFHHLERIQREERSVEFVETSAHDDDFDSDPQWVNY